MQDHPLARGLSWLARPKPRVDPRQPLACPRARFGMLSCALLSAASLLSACHRARPIEERALSKQHAPRFSGTPDTLAPLPQAAVPQHPYMAANGRSAMHVDSFCSNTYDTDGVRGEKPSVQSDSMGMIGGECSTINFDRHGRVIALCVHKRTPALRLLDPKTLRQLAKFELPKRATRSIHVREAMSDTSGGSYFYLDQQDRAVVGTHGHIEIVSLQKGRRERSEFHLDESIDVRDAMEHAGHIDHITAVMPDWQGHYWFAGRYGTVGVVDRRSAPSSDAQGQAGAGPKFIHLAGEEIENSFTVGPEAVYIVSDHALYRMERAPDGSPHVVWRVPYDRGTHRKVGQINQGSGTTPSLLGEKYVAIADNAEPRLNVLVYARNDPKGARKICEVPVFEPHQSATENSMIAYGNSLIVENNAGYDLFLTMRKDRTSAPGIARIDIRQDESGCDLIWQSQEISQTVVPKLSTRSGLVYLYTKPPNTYRDSEQFHLTALDFRTGRTVFKVLTGTGMLFDNNWAELALSPQGAAFVGVLNGLVKVKDRSIAARQ
jgi:hypothetical protein